MVMFIFPQQHSSTKPKIGKAKAKHGRPCCSQQQTRGGDHGLHIQNTGGEEFALTVTLVVVVNPL